jgi:hypothetical protein
MTTRDSKVSQSRGMAVRLSKFVGRLNESRVGRHEGKHIRLVVRP